MKLINNRFYFDFNATSPVDDAVIRRFQTGDFQFGNAASLHSTGRAARKVISETSIYLLQLFNLNSTHDVIYHSGASEGINTFFKGIALKGFKEKKVHHFIFSKLDHQAVVGLDEELRVLGHEVHYFDNDKDGNYDFDNLKNLIHSLNEKLQIGQGIYLNWTWVNNETGVIWPLDDILEIKNQYNVVVHVDAVQSVGKIKDWKNLQDKLDLYTYSAHKFGALKGIGFTFIKKDTNWYPLIHGGSQQDNRRAGTENPMAIESIQVALKSFSNKENYNELLLAKNYIEESLATLVGAKGEIISKNARERNANTIFLLVRGQKAEVLQAAFDMNGVELSTGSACSSGVIKENRVLLNMGYSKEESREALRMSFSPLMTMQETSQFIEKISNVLKKFV